MNRQYLEFLNLTLQLSRFVRHILDERKTQFVLEVGFPEFFVVVNVVLKFGVNEVLDES